MWVWTEAGIGRRLLWHELSRLCGMENGGEQQQYFHNLLLHNTSTNPFEFLKNWRVLQQMLCESYVLLLKQSICTTHAQNLWVHESDKSAAGFVWGMCAVATQTIYCTTLPQTLEFSKNWALLFCSRFYVRYVLLLLKQSIAQHFHKPLSSPRIGN
jgi:hypothetical protein